MRCAIVGASSHAIFREWVVELADDLGAKVKMPAGDIILPNGEVVRLFYASDNHERARGFAHGTPFVGLSGWADRDGGRLYRRVHDRGGGFLTGKRFAARLRESISAPRAET